MVFDRIGDFPSGFVEGPPSPSNRVAVTADPAGGALLFADDEGNASRQVATQAASRTTPGVVNGLNRPLVVDPTHGKVYVGSDRGTVSVFDLQSLQPIEVLEVGSAAVASLALDTGAQRLWIVMRDAAVQEISLDPAPPIVQSLGGNPGLGGTTVVIDAAPDGGTFLTRNKIRRGAPITDIDACGEQSNSLADFTNFHDTDTGQLQWTEFIEDATAPFSVNNRFIVSSAPGYCYVQASDLNARTTRWVELDRAEEVGPVALAEATDTVVLAATSGLFTFDAALLDPTVELFAPGVGDVVAIEISDDGRTVAVVHGGGLSVWDVLTRTRTFHVEREGPIADTGQVDDLAMSHGSADLLAISLGEAVHVWNRNAGTQTLLYGSPVGRIDFSRDGRFLAGDGGAAIWMLSTWERPGFRLFDPGEAVDAVFVGSGPTLLNRTRFDDARRGDFTVQLVDSLNPDAGCEFARRYLRGREGDVAAILRPPHTPAACVPFAS